jgi:hypothetical protein
MLPSLLATLWLTASPDGQAPPPSDAPTRQAAALVQGPPPLPPPPTDAAARVAIELLVAGAAGVGAGAVGGYFGCLASQSPNGQTCSTATVAAAGLSAFGLTIAAIVPLTGNALGGKGLVWVSWLGEAVGLGAGLALAQGNAKNAMYFSAPLMLAGAITGYELSSGWAQPAHAATAGVPSVALQPVNAGAVLAMGGHF